MAAIKRHKRAALSDFVSWAAVGQQKYGLIRWKITVDAARCTQISRPIYGSFERHLSPRDRPNFVSNQSQSSVVTTLANKSIKTLAS